MAKYNMAKIKAEYVTSPVHIGGKDLAVKWNIPYVVLKRHAKKERWVDLRQQTQARLERRLLKRVETRMIHKASEINDSHFRVWQKFFERVEDSFDNTEEMKNILGKTNWKSLKAMSEIMERLQRGQRLARNMDKTSGEKEDGNLSKLVEILGGEVVKDD
jgi:hypothetical protein